MALFWNLIIFIAIVVHGAPNKNQEQSITQNEKELIVSVEQGLLKGEQKWTMTGDMLYYSFKGIPYAAPPVGELRFMAPQPALAWEGVRNATEHCYVCPQFNTFSKKFILDSEDCLCLNVYSPSLTPDVNLPVMVFIHGGGFSFGSGNDDNYGCDFLITENVVIVTINYRLDALGFLNLDSEEVPGNAGMKDQVAALRWVQRNIENFGGDPRQVTIIGQSAGSASCLLHALSPMSKGLFHRVIAMSGVPTSEFAIHFKAKQRALSLAKNLGCESTNTTLMLDFLQNVPLNQLVGTNFTIMPIEDYLSRFTMSRFVPVVENDFGQERFLEESIDVSIQNKRLSDVDILFGYTTAEALAGIFMIEDSSLIQNFDTYKQAYLPRNVIYDTTPTTSLELANSLVDYYSGPKYKYIKTMPQFVNYMTDILNHKVIRYVRYLSKFNENKNIYLYQFSFESERNTLSKKGNTYGITTGVAHGDELNYVFQANKQNLTINKNNDSYKMIRTTCRLLTNFAKWGNPTPDSTFHVKWPKFNWKTQSYMDIGEELTVGKNPNAAMMDFWESIYERAGILF